MSHQQKAKKKLISGYQKNKQIPRNELKVGFDPRLRLRKFLKDLTKCQLLWAVSLVLSLMQLCLRISKKNIESYLIYVSSKVNQESHQNIINQEIILLCKQPRAHHLTFCITRHYWCCQMYSNKCRFSMNDSTDK